MRDHVIKCDVLYNIVSSDDQNKKILQQLYRRKEIGKKENRLCCFEIMLP